MKKIINQIAEHIVEDYKFTVAAIDGTDKQTLTAYQKKLKLQAEQKQLKADRYAVFGAKPWHALPNSNEI